MKKLLIAMFAISALQQNGFAQRILVGIQTGPVFSNYHSKEDGTSDDGKTLTGLTAGFFLDVPMSKNISFQPALNYILKGTKDEQTYGGVTEKVKLQIHHLEIPLNWLYNTRNANGTNFFIGAGPSVTFAISGNTKYDDGTLSETSNLKFGNSQEDDVKGLDIGANFLIGYSLNSGLLFSANYNTGLSNLFPSSAYQGNLKSHYFSIKTGWLFHQKAKK